MHNYSAAAPMQFLMSFNFERTSGNQGVEIIGSMVTVPVSVKERFGMVVSSPFSVIERFFGYGQFLSRSARGLSFTENPLTDTIYL